MGVLDQTNLALLGRTRLGITNVFPLPRCDECDHDAEVYYACVILDIAGLVRVRMRPDRADAGLCAEHTRGGRQEHKKNDMTGRK